VDSKESVDKESVDKESVDKESVDKESVDKESVVDSKDKESSFYNYNKNDSCKTYILFEYVVYKISNTLPEWQH